MTITLSWWIIPLGLFLFPFLYSAIRKPGGTYDFGFDILLVVAICWPTSAAIVITHWLAG